MVELIFFVCLSTDPTACDRKALQFADTTLMTCMMGAQPILAQWTNEHPGWGVRRWACAPAGSDQDI